MKLTIQTFTVSTNEYDQMTVTMPALHVYPFIVHRSLDEYVEKQNKTRTRYSKKHIATHLFTGALLGVFPNFKNALAFVRKLKDRPIFLMPTYDLLISHPDVDTTNDLVRSLKSKYAIQ